MATISPSPVFYDSASTKLTCLKRQIDSVTLDLSIDHAMLYTHIQEQDKRIETLEKLVHEQRNLNDHISEQYECLNKKFDALAGVVGEIRKK